MIEEVIMEMFQTADARVQEYRDDMCLFAEQMAELDSEVEHLMFENDVLYDAICRISKQVIMSQGKYSSPEVAMYAIGDILTDVVDD